MKSRRISLVLVMAVVCVALGLTPLLSQRGARSMAGSPGEQGLPVVGAAPRFLLTGSDGEPFDSAALENKIYVIDFFLTSCQGVCPTMMTHMKRLQTRLAGDEDVVFVSVTTDPDTDTPEEAFLRQWADDVVTRARTLLRKSYENSDSAWEHELFERRVETPEGQAVPTWDELADQYGKTRDQVRYAYSKVQDQARRVLLELMEQEGGNPEAELADLMQYTRARSTPPRRTRRTRPAAASAPPAHAPAPRAPPPRARRDGLLENPRRCPPSVCRRRGRGRPMPRGPRAVRWRRARRWR